MNIFELGDDLEVFLEKGFAPHCLVQAGKKGIEQELWIAVKDTMVSLLIRSKGSKVLEKYKSEEVREWFWFNEKDTKNLFRIIQDPVKRSPLLPLYLLNGNDDWEEPTRVLKVFLSDNNMEYRYDIEEIQ